MSTDRPTPPMVVRGLTFGYDPGQAILEGFGGELTAGKLCALLGPNAAGKSTLLRLMLGQLKPWSGTVYLQGQAIGGLSPRRRAALVSYVPQRAGVSFAFTVEQVVSMGRFALTDDPAAVDRALSECNLTDLRGRIYARLSIGQQQRVLLARAMAQAADQGRIMLLDEPGSAMDLWHTHHTMGLLRSLADTGLAVLVVLHDLDLAVRYADEVWLMDHGRLVAAGPWDQVLVPEKLEPVYRMRLRPVAVAGAARPLFAVDLPAAGR